jgi:hypothetical protein
MHAGFRWRDGFTAGRTRAFEDAEDLGLFGGGRVCNDGTLLG